LVTFYNLAYPDAHVLDHSTISDDDQNTNFVTSKAKVHKYLVLDGRRITATESTISAPNSIVQTDFDGTRYVGQVFAILSHRQPRVNKDETVLDVRWLCRLGNADTSHWDNLWVPFC